MKTIRNVLGISLFSMILFAVASVIWKPVFSAQAQIEQERASTTDYSQDNFDTEVEPLDSNTSEHSTPFEFRAGADRESAATDRERYVEPASDMNVRFAAALPVTVTGRLTSTNGNGIRGVNVHLDEGREAARVGVARRGVVTNSFGYYRFDDVAARQNVSVSVTDTRYTCGVNAFYLTGLAISNFVCSGKP